MITVNYYYFIVIFLYFYADFKGVYQNGKGKIQKNIDLLKNFVYNCIMDKFDG